MNKQRFSENLRRLRLAKGYTQEQLAEKMGVSAQSVSRWECGTTLPDVLQLPDLARLYGSTVEELFREEVTSYPNYAQRLLAVYEITGKTEDFLLAEQEFTHLVASEYTADDLRAFGVLYYYMVKYCSSRAIKYLDAAMEKSNRSDWVCCSAAQQKVTLLCELGRAKEETARYDKELSDDPTDAQRWCLCIIAHHLAGANEKSMELAQRALAHFPDNAALNFHAGDICRTLKRYDEAFTYWSRARELDKTFLDAAYSMGFCYEEIGQYHKAYQVWSDLHKELIDRGFIQESRLTVEHIKLCEEQCSMLEHHEFSNGYGGRK